MKNLIEWIGVFLCLMIFPLMIFGFLLGLHHIDKSKCYEQAELYNSEVIKYSFLKDYCFINKNGENINIDKIYIRQ